MVTGGLEAVSRAVWTTRPASEPYAEFPAVFDTPVVVFDPPRIGARRNY